MKTTSQESNDVVGNTIVHEATNDDIAENEHTELEKKEEPHLENSEVVDSEEDLEEEDEDVVVGNGSESIPHKRDRKLGWPENLESDSTITMDFEYSLRQGKQHKTNKNVASSSQHVPNTSDSQVLDHEEDHVTQPENVQHAVDEHVQPHTDSSQVELILQGLTQMVHESNQIRECVCQRLDAQNQKLKVIIDYIHHHFPPPH
ncbi:hypothetical protein Lal_00011211 [Lupinus albus]|uniref:Uncharacterized protein n=1 Tax=Lupinus albus TaxID=3870 RepID=A0A6A5NVS1_LUPAL|nr:hypothetical protein Lalb_Chr13g0290901 [Lupinus albus]KAF1888440.1 hypothetical protein Lal_00011211 [Lupinus albus]